MAQSRGMTHLEYMRASAAPEVRAFVEWVATELADHLTRDYRSLGLPPHLARREAESLARMVARRALGTAKTFHQFGR